MMQPGQITLNDFELAILERLSQDEPSIGPYIAELHVLSREFTGAGSYTNFETEYFTPGLKRETHVLK